MTPRRRAGRPSSPVLDRERIITGALELLDEVGPDRFSLDALAQRLSVRPSSFYNHTSGKDDILAGVQELVTDAIDATMFTELPWREATSAWAHSYRNAFIAHPNAITLFAISPVMGAARTMHMYEQVVAGFERAGWPQHTIISALVAIESFLLGSALDAWAAPAQWQPGRDAAEVPRFAAAVQARDTHAEETGLRLSELSFELGLAALLDGLAAELDSHLAANTGRSAPTTTPRPTATTRKGAR